VRSSKKDQYEKKDQLTRIGWGSVGYCSVLQSYKKTLLPKTA
jgi:hypothetical protein